MKENYRLVRNEKVDELHGEAAVYEHIKTGAKIFTVKNQDRNKVFMIGFRTIPKDSTGVAHIMEHSVLCGSEKYPLKDPFVELAKGSLNTFLNAMTYPDKTVYPVASVNDKDFMNLMDVYLDSVFHPNVYKEPKIFRQEGWHYEIEDFGGKNEEIKLNGVVYNEMKGAFSNPDSVLERYTLRSLFPDTTYSNESGGLPEVIPELKYEDFLEFHKKFYHPSNSYIYLYGDMDMEEKLSWIDEHYLKDFERIDIDSSVQEQKPYAAPKTDVEYYAVSENDELEKKSYLSENFVILDEPTQENSLAWQVLDFVLLSSPGAVLKEALVKAGIGEDIYGGYNGEIRQPYFSIIAKNTDAEKTELFRKTVRDTLTGLCEAGISKKSILAALNFIEFKYREEDFGTIPGGLSTGLSVLASWLYDRDPYEYVRYNDALSSLKKKAEEGYFEELIRRNILNNDFRAVVNILPERGLTDKQDELLKEKLNKFRASLSEEEKKRLKEDTEALKAYQAEPDTPEAMKTLPVLEISDIGKEAEKLNAAKVGDIIYSSADTSGIAYMNIMFDTEGFNEDEIQFASFLKDIIGEMNTTKHSYGDLFDEILLNTGGISSKLDSYPYREKAGERIGYKGLCVTEIRTLDDKIEDGLSLFSEMINDTVLDNPERITELLNEAKSQQRVSIEGAMHKAAVARAASYFSDAQRYHDIAAGIAYYDFINGAVKLTRQPVHMKRFIKTLKEVRDRLFTKERVSFALYGSEKAREKLQSLIPDFTAGLGNNCEKEFRTGRNVYRVSCLNEGFKTSSQVNYVARGGNFIDKGLEYNGGLQVLRMMLSYEYLWMNLRVLGGAYGCMCSFSTGGLGYLVSYRDPHIHETNDIYEKLPEYLENWDGDEDTVKKYIIGAISIQDMPITSSIQAANQLVFYMCKFTDAEKQKERDEILCCTAEKIRGFAEYIRAILSVNALCVIGNSSGIEKEGSMFRSSRELF